MLRIVAFVAILITVRADASERDKVLEEPKGTHINTIDLLRRQERGNAANGNENPSLLKKVAEGLKDVQDDFADDNESESGDIADDSDLTEDESDGSEEGGNYVDDIQDNSNEEDDSEFRSISDDSEREYLPGKSSESYLSQLNNMLNKADPGLAEEASKRNFEENDMIDGDIKLDEESAAELVDFYKRNPQYLSLDDNVTSASVSDTMDKRKVDRLRIRKWKMPIRYKFRRAGPANRAAVRKAIKIWERETCVRFKEKKTLLLAPPRIIFRGNRKGCWATVGRRLLGNTVNLGKGCRNVATALHEIGHALGFYHEQSRPDRGKYVIIKKGNIQFGKKSNFFIRPSRTYGTQYDYGSIMHYIDTAFAKRKGLKTIIAKQPNYELTMGQNIGLSFYDIKAANLHYCQKRCKGGLRWSKCKHGGYRNPKDCSRCKCLDGWTGRYCTIPSYSKPLSTSCGNRYRSATSSYQSLESPGYPTSDYTPAAKCTWRIRAPRGRRVKLTFSSNFKLACHKPCWDFVEVRHKSLSVTGPRFCCPFQLKGALISSGRYMQVLFRTFSRQSHKGFRAYYKYV